MKPQHKGFTLIELLVSLVILLIVIGTITVGIHSGVSLFSKTKEHGELLTGARHTVESFNRIIAPHLNLTENIKVMNPTPATIPGSSTLSNDECYVFLSGDALMYRTRNGTYEFDGSDKITSVDFVMAANRNDNSPDANILTMKISANSTTTAMTNAKTAISIRKALFDRPDRAGELIGTLRMGSVLYFKSEPAMFERVRMLKYGTNNVIRTIPKSTNAVVELSYDALPKISPLTNASISSDAVVEWFMSASPNAPLTVGTVKPTTANMDKFYWPLVDTGGNPIRGLSIDVSNPLLIKYSAGSEAWNYGAIRCRITPTFAKYSTKREQAAPFWAAPVVITSKSGSLWNDWSEVMAKQGGNDGDKFINLNLANVEMEYVSSYDGMIVAHITKKTEPYPGFSMAALIKPDAMRKERQKMRFGTSPGTAYTTPANYSLIVDAELGTEAGGYAMMVNGKYGSQYAALKNGFYGYGVQYDKKYASFIMRIFKGDNGNGDYWCHGMTPQYRSPDMNIGNSTEDWRRYKLQHMQNASFDVGNYTAGAADESLYTVRRRILYTFLEYYQSGAPKIPRYIVRARIMRFPTEEERRSCMNTDPWCIGKQFFLSEPVWFGGFVGTSTDRSGSPLKYNYTVKNYSGYNSDRIVLGTTPADTAFKDRYVVKFFNKLTGYFRTTEFVFRGRLMDVRTDINNIADCNKLYDNTYNNRYTAMRVWGTSDAALFQAKFYEINIAPGFTENELKTILPANAKVYELSELVAPTVWNSLSDAAKDELYSWKGDSVDGNLNVKLFGSLEKSDGNGNTSNYKNVMDLQHMQGSACQCPLCKEIEPRLIPIP